MTACLDARPHGVVTVLRRLMGDAGDRTVDGLSRCREDHDVPSAGAAVDNLAQARVPDVSAVEAELERLLASPELEASDRRRAFLRYIVEETLAEAMAA